MTPGYIRFFGLATHPFLLAPDPAMFHSFGQYYDCMERLRYAMDTQKGGILLVSEEAGLGKTTILLSLIQELKANYGPLLRYAFIDYPFLTPSELIAQLYSSISGQHATKEKTADLSNLRKSLESLKEEGGKAIAILDEAHLLTEELLQEIRLLMNLQKDNVFLLPLVLSGQRPLWERIEIFPEVFQRLPVRYYLRRLRLEETRELLRGRLKRAGLRENVEIFKDEAIELIHRHGMGIPRTIIVLADLSLLAGFEARSQSVGYKEVEKAITLLKGRGNGPLHLTLGEKKAAIPEKKKHLCIPSRPVVYGLLITLLFSVLFIKRAIMDRPLEYRDYRTTIPVQRVQQDSSKIKAIVSTPLARVRLKPSTYSPVVAHLLEGETLEIEDLYVDGDGRKWCKILLLRGKEGWIREDVLSFYGGSVSP